MTDSGRLFYGLLPIGSDAPAGAGGGLESIATITVGAGGASSIEFVDIPQTFAHLQIRMIGRCTSTTASPSVKVQLNGDVDNNYNYHGLWGNGSTAISDSTGTANAMYPSRLASSLHAGNVFAAAVIDFLDYANTSKNTVARGFTGRDDNSSGLIYMNSSLWMNTSAVTSIVMTPSQGTFTQFSTAALYGIGEVV